MKPELTLKYLSYFCHKKENVKGGFTLIELLVVVIIIGVLAAVALPNLLNQVGKARETEAKNGIGTVLRAQQALHFERAQWTDDLTNVQLQSNNVLGVIIPASKYYEFDVRSITTDPQSRIRARGINNTNGAIDNGKSQGTRDYSGRIDFDSANGSYDQIICQAEVSGTAAVNLASVTDCPNGHTEMQ